MYKLKNMKGKVNRVIVIDAGHGGFDPGALSDSGVEEQEINLNIALKLQRLLEESGTTTFLTRADEGSVGETKREDMKKLIWEVKLLAEKEAETTRLSYNFYKHMKDNGLL